MGAGVVVGGRGRGVRRRRVMQARQPKGRGVRRADWNWMEAGTIAYCWPVTSGRVETTASRSLVKLTDSEAKD